MSLLEFTGLVPPFNRLTQPNIFELSKTTEGSICLLWCGGGGGGDDGGRCRLETSATEQELTSRVRGQTCSKYTQSFCRLCLSTCGEVV